MWFFFAVFSMFFVGISTILSKIGIKGADAYVVGAVTNALLLTAFGLCAWSGGAFGSVGEITVQTWLSVTASGIVLSVSWLFYFLGLKGGSISVFLAIQSFSVIFSMVLCRIFIKEEITLLMALGTALILTGIFLMIERGEISSLKGKSYGKVTVRNGGLSIPFSQRYFPQFPMSL